VEDTGSADLAARVLVPIENTIPEPARYTLYHQGKGQMLDHMLITCHLLAAYGGSEIHNEILHDESLALAFAPTASTPNPTTHLSSPPSNSSKPGRHVSPPTERQNRPIRNWACAIEANATAPYDGIGPSSRRLGS
jgi:hypothetical protein